MIMAGLYFKKDVPYSRVFIHANVNDAQGRRMSKSLGNGIDPVEMVDKFSADAVRFCLVMLTTEGQDVKITEDKFEMGRNFNNKLWNATRFLLTSLENSDGLDTVPNATLMEDRWILSRLHSTSKEVANLLESCKFNEACSLCYHFFWDDFCDWYIEISKARLEPTADAENRLAARQILFHVLENTLALLHSFIPFVTEELWQKLQEFSGKPGSAKGKYLMTQAWPEADKSQIDIALEKEMPILQEIIRSIRNIRSMHEIPGKTALQATIVQSNPQQMELLKKNQDMLKHLANLDSLEIKEKADKLQKVAVGVAGTFKIFIPLEKVMDITKALERMKKDLAKKVKGLAGLNKKLSNEKFLQNADPAIIEHEKARKAQLEEEIEKLRQAIKELS